MKTNTNIKTLKTLSILKYSLLAICICFTSCKKDNNVTISSALMVTNSAETSAPQDFYLDDTKVNSSALAYTQSTGYVTVSGNHNCRFQTSANATVNTIFSASFVPGHYYSVFY